MKPKISKPNYRPIE